MYPKGNLFIPAEVGKLEGILKEPAGEASGVALVCHPHPLGGGTMHNKVVFRAAAGLNDAGLITLRFNFRGVGASDGAYDGEAEQQDVRDCLDYLAENYPQHEITFAGFSFGTWTGSKVALKDKRVVRLISIGTPVDKYDDFAFMEDLRGKPILFVHGDQDEFGSVESLQKLVNKIAQNTETELVIFENCGHFFDEHLSELRETIKTWTARQL